MKIIKEIIIVIVCLSIVSCSGQLSKEEKTAIDKTQLIEHIRDSISKEYFEQNIATNMLSVVPTKTNVVYIGVDNPISISFPNINPKDIRVSATNGGLRKNIQGEYILKPMRSGMCLVSAHTVISGKKINLGIKRFKAKYIPMPTAYVAGKMRGRISKNMLLAQRGISTRVENFDFNVNYKVVSFEVSAQDHGYNVSYKSSSAYFTRSQKALIKRLRMGQKLIIDKIMVVGLSGPRKYISPIALEIR